MRDASDGARAVGGKWLYFEGRLDFECAKAKVHARAPSLASVSIESSL